MDSYYMIDETVPSKKIEVTVLTCLKCGKEWIPKDPNKLPGSCPNPKCRSHSWQLPKGQRKPFTWKSEESKNRNKNRRRRVKND